MLSFKNLVTVALVSAGAIVIVAIGAKALRGGSTDAQRPSCGCTKPRTHGLSANQMAEA